MKWLVMVVLMAVTLLVLLVQDVPLSGYLRATETNRIVTSLERDAFVLAGRSEDSLEKGSTAGYATVTGLARKYHAAGGARVVIVDAQGDAIFTSDTDDATVGASYVSRPEIRSALGGKISTGTRFSRTLGVELLYVAVPVLSGSTVSGAVRLTYPEAYVDGAVNSQLGLLAIAAATSLILAAIVGLLLSTTITASLARLRAVTEILATGRLDERADERHGASEMRSLARSVNSMAGRVHETVEHQRRFSADASHQLRTPLTALRLKLERARELLATDPAAAAERIAAAETEAERLGGVITGLLLLSRLEAGSAPLVTVDAATVARARGTDWEPLAQEAGVTLVVEASGPAPALVIDTAVEQILDNFIDNAIGVSPRGSTVTVRVESDSVSVNLRVEDEGRGLGDEELTQAFERFWRQTTATPGSGLGLAIVAQLATASDAEVWLERREPRGLAACARFIVAPGETTRTLPAEANA